jgi:hypothetical protein
MPCAADKEIRIDCNSVLEKKQAQKSIKIEKIKKRCDKETMTVNIRTVFKSLRKQRMGKQRMVIDL